MSNENVNFVIIAGLNGERLETAGSVAKGALVGAATTSLVGVGGKAPNRLKSLFF